MGRDLEGSPDDRGSVDEIEHKGYVEFVHKEVRIPDDLVNFKLSTCPRASTRALTSGINPLADDFWNEP